MRPPGLIHIKSYNPELHIITTPGIFSSEDITEIRDLQLLRKNCSLGIITDDGMHRD